MRICTKWEETRDYRERKKEFREELDCVLSCVCLGPFTFICLSHISALSVKLYVHILTPTLRSH